MKTTPQSMRDEFAELFCSATAQEASSMCAGTFNHELSAKQLWLLTKFAKYVRLRARNNTAFNNLCNQVFPYAKFTTVTKNRADGTSYPGLAVGGSETSTPETIESSDEE